MVAARVRLGELLVSAQVITREQLEDVLAVQKRDGRRLGTLLVEAGLVSETQVTQILSQQLSVPWVSLYHIDFSRQLLNLVPRDVAERHCLVPIFVRRVRGLGETLYVAMDDPSNDLAVQEVAQASGLPVRTMIAPPSDIRAAIGAYYGARPSLAPAAPGRPSPLPARASPPPPRRTQPSETEIEVDTDVAPSPTPASVEPISIEPISIEATSVREERTAMVPPTEQNPVPISQVETERAEPDATLRDVAPPSSRETLASASPVAARETPTPDSSPQISVREAALPQPKGKRPKMIALTLLDGTTIQLPAARKPQSKPPSEAPAPAPAPAEEETGDQLTARDLVAALRAVSHGADATEILGQNARWEAMFAALLSLLLKKHLIADWEFVEEYRKI